MKKFALDMLCTHQLVQGTLARLQSGEFILDYTVQAEH